MSVSTFSLSGRTALVTGGGQGIGRAIALGLTALPALGSSSPIWTKRRPRVSAEEARASGHAAMPHALDVRDPDAIEAIVQWTDRRSPARSIFLSTMPASGIEARHSFATTIGGWDEVFAVNVRGPFLLSRAFARGMAQRRSGVIIQVASQLGLVGMAGRPAYTASKGAIINLTRTLALEWAPHGIRVNAIAYGRPDAIHRAVHQ